MRLAESKIKQAILHPSPVIRDEALCYFSEGLSRDPEVMPLAIQAIETYGKDKAFCFGAYLEKLVQTEETLEWAINELSRTKPNSPDHLQMCRLIADADLSLLRARKDELLKHSAFGKKYRNAIQKRLELLSWDADDCWDELEEISESEDVGREVARPIIEALSRHQGQADRILSGLAEDIGSWDEDDPRFWMEIFLVMLAGEMRLEAACPLLATKLRRVEDFLAEECVTALTKIGTDSAAMALSEGFLDEIWDYRLYASGALVNIHTDATVAKCLELLPQERKVDIKTSLAGAVVNSFAFEGIEPVAELVRLEQYDPHVIDLPASLASAATIMDVDLPERDIWMREAEERHNKYARRMREMDEWIPPPQQALQREEPEPPRRSKKVGRNDPCPCGSGKKFKKCCLNKKSPFLL